MHGSSVIKCRCGPLQRRGSRRGSFGHAVRDPGVSGVDPILGVPRAEVSLSAAGGRRVEVDSGEVSQRLRW